MFHLRTFGGLALDCDGVSLPLAQRKALALLAVLATSPSRGVERDRLLAILWPESDTERARGALKQTIHVLRQLLGSPDALVGGPALQLNPAVITSDVGAFLDAVAEGDAATAVQLYTGPFLDSVHVDSSAEFERWAEATRGDLARRRAESIEALASAATSAGDHVAAARWWQMLQAADPLSGRIAVKLMHALEAAGDRAAALRHSRVHAELWKQEWGSAPDAEVSALAERLAHAAEPRTSPARGEVSVAEPPAAAPSVVAAPPPRARQHPWIWIGLGAALTVGSLVMVVNGRRQSPTTLDTSSLDAARVAVGVFDNATGDSTLNSLGTMASDWVVRGLARTGVVRVLDAATLYVQPTAGSGARETALELARRNGAGLAVGGRFYAQHDSLLFTASVFDVASGRVLNTLEPVGAVRDRPLPAVEELQQRLAAALVAVIDPRASAYLHGDAARPPTYDAYREFIAAQEKYWRGRTSEGVAGFRRAARMDSSFLIAALWVAQSSATFDDCGTVDSVAGILERRHERLSAAELATLRGTRARCARDWTSGLEAQREHSAAEPGSTLGRWAIGANARRANRPAEAIAALEALDPTRDLGWMSDPGKVMYWRELAWAHHMLGDTAGQWRAVEGLRRMAPGRLATAYFTSLAEVSSGRAAVALRAVDDVEAIAPDPAIVIGEIAGRTAPDRIGTPAWVLYQIATELLSVGDSAGATTLARRAVHWSEGQSAETRGRLETRYVTALGLELEGRVDSALALVRPLVRDAPEHVAVRGRLGVLLARRGDRAAAMAVDAWLAQHRPASPPGAPQLERARIAAVLGDRDRAMQLLETLPFRSHPVDVVFFHIDPAFASLRSDERWVRFLKPRG